MTGVSEPRPIIHDPEEEQRRTELISATHIALTAKWRRYGIEVPPLDEVWQVWLGEAIDTANVIEDAEPRTRMGILAIPPANQLLPAVKNGERIARSASRRCPGWRLLAVDMNPDCGVYLGSPIYFFENYETLAGYGVGELGLVEYEALVLQTGGQVDIAPFAWTWLPQTRMNNDLAYATTDPIDAVVVRTADVTRNSEVIRFRLTADVPHPTVF